MKKIIQLSAVACIAVFAALTLTVSCKKKSSSPTTCTCKYKGGMSGGDTTITYNLAPAGYSSIGAYCAALETNFKMIDPAADCN
ncbi:MAG: hypothetical protein K0Q79_3101 [Flavipsychrobacter sp.]|jgi:hypothetical protein|nr:hypothetical protein [Flavipsychrobacter sp.]